MAREIKNNIGGPRPRIEKGGKLHGIMEESSAARTRRTGLLSSMERDGDRVCATLARRLRAVDRLECALAGDLPRRVGCSGYLTQIATLLQMSATSVRSMTSSVVEAHLPSREARAIAVALTEMVYFADVGTERGGAIDVYLALAREADNLVVALAVKGDFQLLSSADATSGLQRVSAIVDALGGCYARGADAERMVFGITLRFPASRSRRAASQVRRG